MIEDLVKMTESQFKKKFRDSDTEFQFADDERPPTGIVVDNPLLEYILDRRFMAFGRFYLLYGHKGSCKTSLFLDLVKLFQRNGGQAIWLETEHAADLDYARKQGVDTSKLVLQHPRSLEEALNLVEMYLRNLPKVDPDQKTPLLICLDSIAGTSTEYEQDTSHNITDMMPGSHARILSRWYREMEGPLANEKCIFIALNQLKASIGGMSFGEEPPESMMGGQAPMFSSTYQWKLWRTKDLTKKSEAGAERKFGSRHKIVCKRNKLGREGNSQNIEFDLYINGGIDWFSPLVRKLGKEYTDLVSSAGAWHTWKVKDCKYIDPQTGEEKTIDTSESYRDSELGMLIALSSDAKEAIRTAFEIPALPTEQVVQAVEADMKKKRGRKKKTLTDGLDDENS